MHIRYNLEQVLTAAQFLWDNNPACRNWPSAPIGPNDIVDDILRHAERQAQANAAHPHRWSTFSGTGGYIILFTSDDDLDDVQYVDIEVYVDSAVGVENRRYIEQYVED